MIDTSERVVVIAGALGGTYEAPAPYCTDASGVKSWRKSLLPKVGLEPTPTCVDRILSPARLPFRHFGASPQFTVADKRVKRVSSEWCVVSSE